MEKLSDTEMKSVVMAKSGPAKAKFKADISIEDINVAQSCKLVGNGQGGVAGFAKRVANIRLEDDLFYVIINRVRCVSLLTSATQIELNLTLPRQIGQQQHHQSICEVGHRYSLHH